MSAGVSWGSGSPFGSYLAALEADVTATIQAHAKQTQIKTMIPKIRDNFFQELHDLNHCYTGAFTYVLMWFNKMIY